MRAGACVTVVGMSHLSVMSKKKKTAHKKNGAYGRINEYRRTMMVKSSFIYARHHLGKLLRITVIKIGQRQE